MITSLLWQDSSRHSLTRVPVWFIKPGMVREGEWAMEGFRKEPSSLREACGWDENWTVSEWPITNDRPTDCTLIIQRWYGNGGHLLCKVQTVPSHNRYCLLSNMPSTWLPHPLQWECGRQNARASLMCMCAFTCVCENGELFYAYCSNTNR